MGTTTSGVPGGDFSPSNDAGGGKLISGTSKHHPHMLMLPGDKQGSIPRHDGWLHREDEKEFNKAGC